MPQVALVFHTYEIVGEPSDDAETVIAILDQVDTIWPTAPVNLHGWVDFAPDADATYGIIRIRRGSLTGDIVDNRSATVTFAAAADQNFGVGIDVRDTPGDLASATYVLTLSMNDAAAPTSIGALHLSAQV